MKINNQNQAKKKFAKNQLKTMIAEFPNLSTLKAASALQVILFTFIHDNFVLKPYKFHDDVN
jgi:hypothetical protein